MKYIVWTLVLVLVVLHQDYWQWDNATLVFGFLPHSLAYHGAISLAAGAIWWLAVYHCWPADVDSIQLDDDDGKART